VVRHHGVGVVVAAVQEDAHQRLVVRAVEGGGFADGGEIDGQRCSDAHGAQLQAALQHQSSRPVAHFCTRYSGEISTRKAAVASMLSLASCVLAAVMLKAVATVVSTASVSVESWLAVSRRLNQATTCATSCATGNRSA